LELTLSDGTRLVLGSTIYHQDGIIGCGTCVVRARRVEKTKDSGTDDDTWDGPLIVKLSWPAKSRISEDIILKACNAGNHDEHRLVLKHSPQVLHAEDRHVNLLLRALIDRISDHYEERVPRIMVQEELFPITEQTAAADFAQSFREIFKCMYSPSVPLCATAHSFDSKLQMAI
jgi:Fungal protein kinase